MSNIKLLEIKNLNKSFDNKEILKEDYWVRMVQEKQH